MLAQEAARTHKHDPIGTEHLLLGLLGEPRGLAYECWWRRPSRSRGSATRSRRRCLRPGRRRCTVTSRSAPDSKEAIEQALRASSDLGHDWVGTEHTLLGLIRVEESLAAQILRDLGFTPDTLRDLVMAGIAERLAAAQR